MAERKLTSFPALAARGELLLYFCCEKRESVQRATVRGLLSYNEDAIVALRSRKFPSALQFRLGGGMKDGTLD